jgi:hypothetical protein
MTPTHVGADVAKFTSVQDYNPQNFQSLVTSSLPSLVDHQQLILEYVGAPESEIKVPENPPGQVAKAVSGSGCIPDDKAAT